ncbi:MAG: SDR family NAD(P)-dependent oxidoreductase [Nocardioidaceae bacterium]
MNQAPASVAVVTGANGGIGAAVARTLAARGYQLVLAGFNGQTVGHQLASELGSAVYLDADLSQPAGAQDVADLCAVTYGRLDLLVNNAGIGIPVPHADLQAVTADFFTRMLEVNLLGPWHLTRASEAMLKTSGGLVINVSSVAGSTVSGSSIPYAVSKAGLEHMTRCLAVAMGPEVRVNAIAPGYIETERTREWVAVRDQVVQHAPAARLGTPSDVATAILTLIDATYTTGAVLPVDGGLGLV